MEKSFATNKYQISGPIPPPGHDSAGPETSSVGCTPTTPLITCNIGGVELSPPACHLILYSIWKLRYTSSIHPIHGSGKLIHEEPPLLSSLQPNLGNTVSTHNALFINLRSYLLPQSLPPSLTCSLDPLKTNRPSNLSPLPCNFQVHPPLTITSGFSLHSWFPSCIEERTPTCALYWWNGRLLQARMKALIGSCSYPRQRNKSSSHFCVVHYKKYFIDSVLSASRHPAYCACAIESDVASRPS